MSKDIFKSFEQYGFKSYLKIPTLHCVDKLICQYESITKLLADNESPFDDGFDDSLIFDLVIIDEAKSFYNHTFAPTHKKENQFNFQRLDTLCNNAGKLIFLDGDNDAQVYYNARNYGGGVRIIENEYNDNNRTIKIMKNRTNFQDKIDNRLKR